MCSARCSGLQSVQVPDGLYTMCKASCGHVLPDGTCVDSCGELFEYGDLCVERCPDGFPYANVTPLVGRAPTANKTAGKSERRTCVASCAGFVVEDTT